MKDHSSPIFTEVGSTGLKRAGGFINQEWLRQLSSPTLRYRAYSEMRDNDAVIGSILYAIESMVRQVEWKVKPAGHDPMDLEAARFLESCMIDMAFDWETFVSEALTMLPYGYSIFETVYKVRGGMHQEDPRYHSRYSDGRIGWRKLAVRGQDTIYKWKFCKDGTIDGFYQIAPPDYVETFIPLDKCILFRTKVERNNPEGRSLLRNAYRSWFFLKRLQEIEAIGIERDLAGLPVMQVPVEIMSPSATSAQSSLRTNLEQIVQQIRRDEREGIVMPSEKDRDGNPTGYKLGLLSTGGSRQMDTDKVIKRYESRIAMSVLAEFIMLGMDKVGSFALADSKTDLFATSLRTIMETLVGTFNSQAVVRLFEMNPEFPEHCWPELTYGDFETQDLEAMGRYIQSLSNAGVLTPDPDLEESLREIANLPTLGAHQGEQHDGDNHLYDGSEPSIYGPIPLETLTPSRPNNYGEPDKVDPNMINAVMRVVESVENGTISREAAAGVLRSTVPNLSDEHLEQMLSRGGMVFDGDV